MIKLSETVCSYQQSLTLKKEGVNLLTLFDWISHGESRDLIIQNRPYKDLDEHDYISAFTSTELGILIPSTIEYKLQTFEILFLKTIEAATLKHNHLCLFTEEFDRNQEWFDFVSDSEPNLKADVLIHLIKNNFIIPSELKL